MRFKTLNGNQRTISKAHKYIVDWEGKSRSKIQFKVKAFLKEFWEKKIVFEEFPVAGTRLSFDLFNASEKIAIEVQGEQHTKYVPFFHGKNKYNYLNQLFRDKEKYDFCKLNDIQLVEIYYSDEITKKLFKEQGVTLI